ncbi:MAG: YlmC/YmxH family sporulation protein [Ruminococcus sp.]|nr:YlmC/YmxH family sporulation protein [Ruminococcus sp.]
MICSLAELKDKDIINISSGENLGYADDVCLDTKTAAVTGIVIYGKPRYFGIFGAREKSIIGYEHIRLIGKDVILVELKNASNLFSIDKLSS